MNVINQVIADDYAFYNADSVEFTEQIPENSLHFIMFSPPFSSLYTYSNSDRDMGNCKGDDEFADHFKFLAKQLYRTLKPGRIMAVHCMDLPKMKSRDGVIGLKDFPGLLVRIMEDEGFVFHGRTTIFKNPVQEMVRTKALGLLHKQIRKDSTMCRSGCADYILAFRKPGENEEFVKHTSEEFPVSVWQHYASPVWVDINQSDTLQKNSARDDKDEKHICPLQLEVIKRCIELYTNEGDIVYDPFGGIGSVPYVALRMGRRGLGCELKESYYKQAAGNLANAVNEPKMGFPVGDQTIYDFIGEEETKKFEYDPTLKEDPEWVKEWVKV